MIILPQKVTIKWNRNNKKHYEQLGYKYTALGDEFKVNINELTKGSHIIIECKCDYCGKIMKQSYQKYYRIKNSDNSKDCCKKCTIKKIEENNLEKYGVKYSTQTKKMKDKSKQTMLEKYGVKYSTQTKKMKDKSKQTILKKYGVENVSQSKEIKEKKEKTCLKHYGVKYSLQSKEIRNQIEKTNLKKYGFKTPAKNNMIKQKYIKTMYQNNTAPCSKQQKHIFNLLNINDEYKLNYPVNNLMLDIANIHNKIYIEYDGGGHDLSVKLGKITQKEFNIKEIKRQYYLKLQGWKLIRIKCEKDKLPNDEKIIIQINNAINYLKNTQHTWIKLNWD